MKTIILLLLPLSMAFVSMGQNLNEAKKALKKINSMEQLEQLKSQYPKWTISSDKTMHSDSSRFPDIIKAKIGDVVLKQYAPNAPAFVLKVIEEKDEELCKLKYIYLDGSKLSRREIDSMRTAIINRYKSGSDFETLVKEYTMDRNPTGDLDWFYKGMMVDEFDSAVRNRRKDEIFTVDVHKNNWFYVVLKTHDNKIEKARIGIKIKYNT